MLEHCCFTSHLSQYKGKTEIPKFEACVTKIRTRKQNYITVIPQRVRFDFFD